VKCPIGQSRYALPGKLASVTPTMSPPEGASFATKPPAHARSRGEIAYASDLPAGAMPTAAGSSSRSSTACIGNAGGGTATETGLPGFSNATTRSAVRRQ
jgi:hypothetical protein